MPFRVERVSESLRVVASETGLDRATHEAREEMRGLLRVQEPEDGVVVREHARLAGVAGELEGLLAVRGQKIVARTVGVARTGRSANATPTAEARQQN